MERDEVRNSLTLYFLLSNNVCLLNWSTHSVEFCYFLLFILMILLMHFPLGCIFQNDSSLTPDIQAFLLPANEVMTYHLGWLDSTFLLGLPQSCALLSPFRPLLVTCLTVSIPEAQLSVDYCSFCELFMCHCATSRLISQSMHPIRKAPLLTLAAKLILHSLF